MLYHTRAHEGSDSIELISTPAEMQITVCPSKVSSDRLYRRPQCPKDDYAICDSRPVQHPLAQRQHLDHEQLDRASWGEPLGKVSFLLTVKHATDF